VWEESWAQPAIQWLLTPTLITGALLALARFFDPPTRWARRLRSDISIVGGLPDGSEKQVWQASIDKQAMRLREYRRAFVGWTLFWKWVVVAFVAVAVFGLILYPPINEPGDPIPYGPFDYMMMFLGLLACVTYVVAVSTGNDFLGRSPRDILLGRRLRKYNRRLRKLRRIEKIRAERAKTDPTIKPKGSRLGFSTQVDEFGPWMRDDDVRDYVGAAGIHAADFRARAAARLNARHIPPPPWPDPVTRRAPEPQPAPAPLPKGWRRWLRLPKRRSE
jgi:hypothetical protein